MKVHKLKTWPKYFKGIKSGEKTFEIRKNDRDFKEGDILILEEYDPKHKAYTGQRAQMKVEYILFPSEEVEIGIKDGFCIMAIVDNSAIISNVIYSS